MANVGPAAIGKPLTWVIYKQGSPAANSNAGNWSKNLGSKKHPIGDVVTVGSAAAYYEKQNPTPTW